MMSTIRSLALLAGALSLCASACQKGPKPLPLKSVGEARAQAMGSAVLPNLNRTFERVDDLAKVLSLPYDKAAKRASFMESLKIPAALLGALRTDAPVAIVGLPGKDKPDFVAAIAGTSAGALKSAIASLGKPVANQADANTFQVGKDTVWLVQRSAVLLAAPSVGALIAGGALALDVAVASEDDLVVRVSPEAVAKGQGTDLKTVLAGMVASGTTSMEGMPGQNPIVTSIMKGILQGTADRVAEVEEATMSVRLDAAKGATIRIGAVPKKGSKLAGWLGKTAPYALDGRVLPAGETMVVMACSPTDLFETLWSEARPLVARDKAGEDAAKQLDTLSKAWGFGASGAAALEGKEMKLTGTYGLKPGLDGDSILSAMAGLLEGPWYKSLRSDGEMKGKVTTKREKNLLVVNVKNGMKQGLPKRTEEILKDMGLSSQTYAVTVEKGAALYATGADAAAKVQSLATQPPRKASGLVAQALAESTGADAIMYVDFGPFVRLVGSTMGMGASPAFSGLTLPIWTSYRAGTTPTLELRIPIEMAKSVSAFLPMLMQLGLAGKGLGGPS